MLKSTLAAFARVDIPVEMRVEMLVVDNGSVDDTPEVIRSASHRQIKICYIYEPLPGKSRALNAALAAAKGEVILFTDDDVVPAEDWIEEMSKPLLERQCDAVAGRILLAESLHRPWFTPMHELWLAFIREPAGNSPELVGASMGIHRSVFDRFGAFDENLGPGASGFGEETLLCSQMHEAGLRILPVMETHVVHYPEESRLLRASWLAAAARFGHTQAYVMHHWEHSRERYPAAQLSWIRMKLFLRSLFRQTPALEAEGCPAWEMSYLVRIETLRRFMKESRNPRNYERRGLRKVAG